MNFNNELKALMERGIRPTAFPPMNPGFLLYADVSTRSSTCRGCADLIPKKSGRVVVLARHAMVRKYPNGGLSLGCKNFFHRSCFYGFIDGVKMAERFSCWDCGEPWGEASDCAKSQVMLVAKHGTREVRVCDTCVQHRRYRLCEICGNFYPRHQTSLIVKWDDSLTFIGNWHKSPAPDDYQGKIGCVSCVQNDGYITVKMLNEHRTQETKFKQKYDAIVEKLERGEM